MNNNTRKIVSYLLATMTIVNSQSLLIDEIACEKTNDTKIYEDIKTNNREVYSWLQYEPYSIETEFKSSENNVHSNVKKYIKKK